MLLEISRRQVESDITVVESSGPSALRRESQRIEPIIDGLGKAGMQARRDRSCGISHIDSAGIGMLALAVGKLKRPAAT